MKRTLWKRTLGMLAAVVLLTGIPAMEPVHAEGTITVVANTANVRESADATSSKVGSVSNGQSLSVLAETTDGSGMVWYQVSVNGATGYIRSDLVKQSGDNTTAQTPAAETPSEGGATEIPPQGATVIKDNVNIRSTANTSGSVVVKASNGTAVTVVAKDTDSAGKTWYQVKFISNGAEVTGFIRSDFIELGEVIEQPEKPKEEEPQEEQPQEPEEVIPTPDVDYALEYTTNQEGEYEWYLNDYTNSRRQKLNDLLNAQENVSEGVSKLEATAAKQKMIIIVLAVILALLAVVVTILLFKIRESGYEYDDDDDDDEDDEDEEDEEEAPARFTFKKRKFLRDDDDEDDDDDEEEEEPRPVRRAKPTKPIEPSSYSRTVSPQKPVRQPEVSYNPKAEVPGKQVADQSNARKSRNFLVDDDEFEFEFLNLNDKK